MPILKFAFKQNKQGLLSQLNSLNVRLLSTGPAASTAEKAIYKRDKPHINIGTIGHVDHGKTTLTAAITHVLQSLNLCEAKKYDDVNFWNHIRNFISN